MDEISTGLDSSTTYQIVRSIGNVAHLREATVLMSLLQPPPETFDLFDDVMLLADGAAGCPVAQIPLCVGRAGRGCSTSASRGWKTTEVARHQALIDLLRSHYGVKLVRCTQLTLRSVLDFAGVIVYHGPRDEIIPFFVSLGFELPERKGAADFLQEITSRKDQKVFVQMTLLSMTRT